MKLPLLLIISTILELTSISSIFSQILPTQNNCYFPTIDSTQKASYLANSFLNTEFLITNGSYQGDKDRIYRLMSNLELYKSDNSALSLYLANELNCNTKNDIGFNPRQVIWEEKLSYFRKYVDYILNLSVFHRCKHEIDNSDSPSGDSANSSYVPTKRVVVVNGINLGLTSKLQIMKDLDLNFNLNTDIYKTTEDFRTPAQSNGNVKPDWNDLSSTIRTNLRFNYSLSESFNLYTRFNFNLLLFMKNHQNYTKENHAIELGANIKGKDQSFELFLISESLFDELAFIIPNPTRYFGLGVRLRGNEFF